jgi:hypothetical protein
LSTAQRVAHMFAESEFQISIQDASNLLKEQ